MLQEDQCSCSTCDFIVDVNSGVSWGCVTLSSFSFILSSGYFYPGHKLGVFLFSFYSCRRNFVFKFLPDIWIWVETECYVYFVKENKLKRFGSEI